MEGAMFFGPCLSGPVALKSVPAFTNGDECSDLRSRAVVFLIKDYGASRIPEQVSQY